MPRTLVTAPAFIRWNVGGVAAGGIPGEILIRPSDQMDAMTLTFNETFAEQMSQASTTASDAVVSGFDASATISIAKVGDLTLFDAIFQGSTMLTTGSGATLKTLVGIASRPGCPVVKRPTLVKLADCGGESTDTSDWFYFPNAALVTDNTSMSFSNSDQSSYNVKLMCFEPDPSSDFFPYKALRGDISLIQPITRTVDISPTAGASIAETGGTRTFTVTLSSPHSVAVTIPYTVTGTATPAVDFTLSPATPLTIAAGQTTVSLTLTSIADAVSDANETVIITLGAPTNANLGTNTTVTTTIL